MKIIIITFTVFLISSLAYGQSSIVYDVGTTIQVEIGTDICADSKTINGTWIGGGTFCEGALPVELISFTSSVSMQGRDVTLTWKTDKEINNSGFNVDRKIKGTNEWKKITFVQGKGNSETHVQYTFVDKKLNSGKYNYRLKQVDYNGNYKYYDLNSEVEIGLPKKFNLSQNYPNPFNPNTKIDFELPLDGKVSIAVYDITGREIAVLLNNEFRIAGYYTADFNGSRFSSGVYFYRFASEKYNQTKKMMIIK
jgi:hypothetical protein